MASVSTRSASDMFIDGIVRNINHEFRTPLNLLIGHCELLSDHLLTDNAEVQESLEAIIRASKHLEALIRDLLTFARMEKKALEPTPAAIKLGPILKRLDGEWRPKFEDKNLAFSSQVKDADLMVRGDEECLYRALDHLLDNANKFTKIGGAMLRARKTRSGTATIVVSDTGIGIAPDDRKRIFAPFFQADMASTRHFRGLGLGLTLAKRYLHLNNARLSVRSTPGRGSVFVVSFGK